MTSSPKLFGSGSTSWAYTNDILGNRTWRNNVYSGTGATRYDWDIVNRMLLCANATSGSTYSYRADGQRIEKVDGVTLSWTGNRESGHYDTNYATSRPTYRYFYDGQMGIEDDYNPSGTVTKVNRYGLGARGIDRIEAWDGTNTTYGYPLYDGHGNMRTTLARSGSSYSTGNWRTYDVWGGVRTGNGTGDPKQRYCANLGHVQDDESGLIYMRARYHDPLTGRFVSEDPARDGLNWFVYCGNDPINFVDGSGNSAEGNLYQIVGMSCIIVALLLLMGGAAPPNGSLWVIKTAIDVVMAFLTNGIMAAYGVGAILIGRGSALFFEAMEGIGVSIGKGIQLVKVTKGAGRAAILGYTLLLTGAFFLMMAAFVDGI